MLAGVVFLIGVEFIDAAGTRSILQARRAQFGIALITTTTVVVGVEQGILLAVAISMIAHLRHSTGPRIGS